MTKLSNWKNEYRDTNVTKCDVEHPGGHATKESCTSCKKEYCAPCKEQHPYTMEKREGLCISCGAGTYERELFEYDYPEPAPPWHGFDYDDGHHEDQFEDLSY